jgi:bifunctional non-homologous end joining protein LigD
MSTIDFVPCQLALAARAIPTGSNWLYEPKYDGYRCQLVVRSGETRLFTRTGLDWTERLGVAWLREGTVPRADCVIDGEICVLDSDGRPDFGLLGKGLSDPATDFSFFAFDLLSHAGELLTDLPLGDRKQRLPDAVSELGLKQVHVAQHTNEGHALFEKLRELRWEGIMAKDITSSYQSGIRSPAWRKIKFTRRQEFVVAGWRVDQTTGTLKSIVLATVEDGELVLRGSVGSGFSSDERLRLPGLFSKVPASLSRKERDVRWLQPSLVAEIEFLELSSNGCVRGASYLGLREDKTPSDVSLEGPT